MAGLIDKKSRIMDTILTNEGRRQLASGKLNAVFYSFTDNGVFYNFDTVSGSNISRRISIEATSSPQDQVTFEADDSGRLMPMKSSPVQTSAGKIVTTITGTAGTVSEQVEEVNDIQFASLANTLLNSSLDNFKNLYVIGSPDIFNENKDQFVLSRNNINFTITPDKPISKNQLQTLSINHAESFFMDKRFSHVPNFLFLPPVNKKRVGSNEYIPLGIYNSLGQRPIFEFNDLQKEIENYEKNGFVETINFTRTSKENNVFCQFFELSNGEVKKLDCIDFGLFNTSNNQLTEEEKLKAQKEGRTTELESTSKHVFFVGKVFVDDFGAHTFINMFSIIFCN